MEYEEFAKVAKLITTGPIGKKRFFYSATALSQTYVLFDDGTIRNIKSVDLPDTCTTEFPGCTWMSSSSATYFFKAWITHISRAESISVDSAMFCISNAALKDHTLLEDVVSDIAQILRDKATVDSYMDVNFCRNVALEIIRTFATGDK